VFDFVRNNKRLMQGLLALIILPFAFFGIDSYQRLFGGGGDIATVDGSSIAANEFNHALERQKDQLRSVLGRNADASLLDSPQMRNELLEQLISQRLLLAYGAKNNLVVNDELLRETIAAVPAFQEAGKFSLDQYRALLRGQNMTEAMFEQGLRRDLVLQQIAAGIADSGFVSKTAARQALTLLSEQREVAEVVFGPGAYAASVKVTPETVQRYYQENPKQFEIPEQVRVEYVVLSPDAIAAQEPVSLEDARKWYQEHLAQYQQSEQRQASHILIAAGKDDKERAAARKKAEDVRKEVLQSPGKFAELAKKYSQDPGSSGSGGDLGFFARGAMVKGFEDAAFRLKTNEVSDVVESDFGFHVIRVTAIRPERTVAFEDARPAIEKELAKQRVGRKFAEAAETFSNIAYEQPDSLKPLTERFKLKPATSGWIDKGAPAKEGPLANSKLVAAVFGDDAIKNKRNTEVVEVGPSTLAVARVVEHRPAAMKPFDAVKADIEARLRRQEGAAVARKTGSDKLATLGAGTGGDLKWSAPRTVSRDNPGGMRSEALREVFRADPAKLPVYVGVDLGQDGYAIYRVSKVSASDKLDASRLRSAEAGLARQEAIGEYEAFVEGLRSRAKVEVNRANLEKPSG